MKVETAAWRHPRTGEVRHYVANVYTLIGLDTWKYNTGNVKGAQLDGKDISNGKARELMNMIDAMKIWRDARGVYHWWDCPSSRVMSPDEVMERIRRADRDAK